MRMCFLSIFLLLLSVVTFSGLAYSEPVVAGPIEIVPINATLIMLKDTNVVRLSPTIKFTIKNKSSSDLKIVLLAHTLDAQDDLNQRIFPNNNNELSSSGISMSNANEQDNNKIFINDKSKFVSMSPGQSVQAYIYMKNVGYGYTVRDPSGDFYKTHRPQTMTFNGAIGIINVDGSTDVRVFSLSDIPVTVTLQ